MSQRQPPLLSLWNDAVLQVHFRLERGLFFVEDHDGAADGPGRGVRIDAVEGTHLPIEDRDDVRVLLEPLIDLLLELREPSSGGIPSVRENLDLFHFTALLIVSSPIATEQAI